MQVPLLTALQRRMIHSLLDKRSLGLLPFIRLEHLHGRRLLRAFAVHHVSAMAADHDARPTVVYQPLKDRQIRILKLLPGNRDEDIRCELELFQLFKSGEQCKDKPVRQKTYEAISYVWGDPTDKREVYLDGISMRVTKNLHTALLHFRLRFTARYVWADAICINQEDLVERSSQVLLMTEVYQQCSRCLIWLGEEAECDQHLSYRTESKASGILDHPSNQLSTLKAARILLEAMSPRFWGKPVDDSVFSTASVQSLIDMMSRPWWKRIWTIQEALLPYRSARQVRVFLGPDELNFDVFLEAATGWATFEDRVAHAAKQNGKLEWISAISSSMNYIIGLNSLHMYLGRHTYRQEIGPSLERDEQGKALHAHLAAIAGHECTNPRDAVYGLLGLFDRTALIDCEPNYAEGLDKCFSMATRTYIFNSGGLHHLQFANSLRNISENLPSLGTCIS